MKTWIFKIIYIPILISIAAANMGIIAMIVKEAGFKAPYTWMLIIMIVACFADWYLNK
jgi:hypothetical protein